MALVTAGVIKRVTPGRSRNVMPMRVKKMWRGCRGFQVKDRHEPDRPMFRINY